MVRDDVKVFKPKGELSSYIDKGKEKAQALIWGYHLRVNAKLVDIINKTDWGILVSLSSNTSKHWFLLHFDRPGWVNARALTTYLRKYDPTFEVKGTAFEFSIILG